MLRLKILPYQVLIQKQILTLAGNIHFIIDIIVYELSFNGYKLRFTFLMMCSRVVRTKNVISSNLTHLWYRDVLIAHYIILWHYSPHCINCVFCNVPDLLLLYCECLIILFGGIWTITQGLLMSHDIFFLAIIYLLFVHQFLFFSFIDLNGG